jgi:hypothetical protein
MMWAGFDTKYKTMSMPKIMATDSVLTDELSTLLEGMSLVGNEKRKASCKAVGGAKKRTGHSHESVFNRLFGLGDATEITYKAEADCLISNSTSGGAALLTQLTDKFGPLPNHNVSVKSGKNLQFVLGNIPEITGAPRVEDKLAVMSQRSFWEKYLGKSKSGTPAGLLVYRKAPNWKFFLMANVIDHIVSKGTWRMLPTGRIKGDYADSSRKGKGAYLTCEYRPTHKSYLLAANCGVGEKWINLLTTALPHIVVADPSSPSSENTIS